jgi:hypothetical protein
VEYQSRPVKTKVEQMEDVWRNFWKKATNDWFLSDAT